MSVSFYVQGEKEGTFDENAPELNVANGNLSIIAAMLNIEMDFVGEIDADQLEILISNAVLKTRKTVYEKNFTSCGCPKSQSQSYLDRLQSIAAFAKTRSNKIYWC